MRCWCVLQGRAVPPCVQRWTHRRQNEEEAAASPFRFKGEKCALHSPPVRTLSLQHTQKSHNSFFFLPLRRAARQAKKKGGGGDHISLTHFCRIISTLSFTPPPHPLVLQVRERERGRAEQNGKEREGGENHFSHLLAVVILLLLLLLPPSSVSSFSFFPLHMRGGGGG